MYNYSPSCFSILSLSPPPPFLPALHPPFPLRPPTPPRSASLWSLTQYNFFLDTCNCMRVSLLLYVDRDRMDYYSIRDVGPGPTSRTSTSSFTQLCNVHVALHSQRPYGLSGRPPRLLHSYVTSMLLYIHRDRMDYRDVHLVFYTAM